jgi:hypothetical protein
MKSRCTRASMPSMYEFRHHLENGCVGHAHAKCILILQRFSNFFPLNTFLTPMERKRLEPAIRNAGDNHAQTIPHDRRAVGVAGNIDGGECR